MVREEYRRFDPSRSADHAVDQAAIRKLRTAHDPPDFKTGDLGPDPRCDPMINGVRIDSIVYDEVDAASPSEVPHGGRLTNPRREIIAVRRDGSTYRVEGPADFDLGDLLGRGDVVGFDYSR